VADFSHLDRRTRAAGRAPLRDMKFTVEDIAWLFGITTRWAGHLRSIGVLPPETALPQLVENMATYKAEAKRAKARGRRG